MNYEAICEGTREIVRETGIFIQEEAKNFKRESVEFKGLHNLVSYVDKSAEEKLVAGLRKVLPEAGFITEEETTTERGTMNWIIDPLDGTTNFIHGLPVYSISIALHDGKELVCGVVHELNLDECFYTWKGAPSFMNGTEIHVSAAKNINESLLATGFPYYDFALQEKYMALLNELIRKSEGVRRLGSAAVDLVYTAAGRFDAYYEYNVNAWDIAAGAIIVQNAGGFATDFGGESGFLDKREIVCANPAVHAELLDVIKKHFAES